EGPDLRGHAERLRAERDRYLQMGGADRVAKQHADGKLTVRERLDRLFDPGSFTELSLLAHHQGREPAMQGKSTPADGCVTGIGRRVKGTWHMALGGPRLVEAAVGEDVTAEEMGGSAVHTKISGVADLEVADDQECLEVVRRYLGFFPSSNLDKPPVQQAADP